MKKTGEILKKEREARGLSLHEIGLSLKINSKILKAIEEGEMSQLPAKTFLRGFVQSYASYLKLNIDEVLKVFSEEMGSTRPQVATESEAGAQAVQNSHSVREKEKSPKTATLEESSTTKAVIFSLVAVILAGLITIVVKLIDKYQKEAQVAVVDVKPIETPASTGSEAEPIANSTVSTGSATTAPALPPSPSSGGSASATATTPLAAAPPEAHPAPTEHPKENPTAKLPEASKPIEVKPVADLKVVKPIEMKPLVDVKVPAEKLPEKPVDKPTVKPTDKPVDKVAEKPAEKQPDKPLTEKPMEKKPEIAAAATPDKKAEDAKKVEVKPRSIELIVEALDAVEIEYSAGNGKLDKIRLSPEQVHTFKSKAGLKLSISNGGAVNVILNGKDLGVPGDLGKPIKLNY